MIKSLMEGLLVYENYCDIRTKTEFEKILHAGEERLYMKIMKSDGTYPHTWMLVSSLLVKEENEER